MLTPQRPPGNLTLPYSHQHWHWKLLQEVEVLLVPQTEGLTQFAGNCLPCHAGIPAHRGKAHWTEISSCGQLKQVTF